MTLSVVMYKNLGVSDAAIALWTSWLYLPWVVKPLWSPLVDMFGRNRAWIAGMQLAIGAAPDRQHARAAGRVRTRARGLLPAARHRRVLAFLLLYRFAEAPLRELVTPVLLDPAAVGGLGLQTQYVGIAYGTLASRC